MFQEKKYLKCKNCGGEIMYFHRTKGWVHRNKSWGQGSAYGHPMYNDGTYCHESKIKKAEPEDGGL
jgi:hypothetical protein